MVGKYLCIHRGGTGNGRGVASGSLSLTCSARYTALANRMQVAPTVPDRGDHSQYGSVSRGAVRRSRFNALAPIAQVAFVFALSWTIGAVVCNAFLLTTALVDSHFKGLLDRAPAPFSAPRALAAASPGGEFGLLSHRVGGIPSRT